MVQFGVAVADMENKSRWTILVEAIPVRYGLLGALHHSRVGAIAVCGCEIRSPFREIVAFADVMDQ